jgi:hypothetical protein
MKCEKCGDKMEELCRSFVCYNKGCTEYRCCVPKKRNKTPVERLVERLRKEGFNVPEDYKFRRCYHGHWQRSAGGWSWFINGNPNNSIFEVGSCDSVAVCLKAKEWDILGSEIIPVTWKKGKE